MEVREIRIGNLVLDRLHKTLICIYDFERIRQHPLHNLPFIGIPLTEEWLLKFGFEDQYNYYCYNDFKIWQNDNGFFCKQTDLEIKNIHQLQNLYFALTGEELKSIS